MTLVGSVRKNKRFLPSDMQPVKERRTSQTCFYHEETQSAKPDMIKYYNETKGGVDTMDKMLSEYTVKRRTLRWSLAFFYNILDVTGLASYIIYREHNPQFKTKDQRRKFLKDLANQLSMPSIEARRTNQLLMRNHFLRGEVEMVLGRRIVAQVPHRSRGPSPIVGSCYVCRNQKRKQPVICKNTRKSSEFTPDDGTHLYLRTLKIIFYVP
ncbi:hypothetical protein CBL_20822 [Carabus blaptoides fortunei]